MVFETSHFDKRVTCLVLTTATLPLNLIANGSEYDIFK